MMTFISSTFLLAGASKLLNRRPFQQSLVQLRIPFAHNHTTQIALLIIGLEAFAGVLIFAGGRFTVAGFLLATGLMIGFTIVIANVLLRGVSRHCNCFGKSNRPINILDLIRNIGICACSTTGICLTQTTHTPITNKLEVGVITILGMFIALIWANLGDIYHLIKS